jgi:hypothetical protein
MFYKTKILFFPKETVVGLLPLPILAMGLALIHLVNLSTMISRWVKSPGAFLKGPKRSRPHTTKGHVMGMVWSSWAGTWICLAKYWHPLQDLMI